MRTPAATFWIQVPVFDERPPKKYQRNRDWARGRIRSSGGEVNDARPQPDVV